MLASKPRSRSAWQQRELDGLYRSTNTTRDGYHQAHRSGRCHRYLVSVSCSGPSKAANAYSEDRSVSICNQKLLHYFGVGMLTVSARSSIRKLHLLIGQHFSPPMLQSTS